MEKTNMIDSYEAQTSTREVLEKMFPNIKKDIAKKIWEAIDKGESRCVIKGHSLAEQNAISNIVGDYGYDHDFYNIVGFDVEVEW